MTNRERNWREFLQYVEDAAYVDKRWAERSERIMAEFGEAARRWADTEGPKIMAAFEDFSRACARVKWPRRGE